MPLSLNVPDLEDKPLIQADTHPQKISQFIDSLPTASALEAGAALQVEIQMLNRQRIAPDIRVKALETYRPTLINITETLATQYCSALLPLPESAQQHAALAESLWLELAYGYKLALIDQQNKLFSLSGSKGSAWFLSFAQCGGDALSPSIEVRREAFGRTIERGRLLAGRFARMDASNEVALSENPARLLGVGVGDTVALRTFAPDQL